MSAMSLSHRNSAYVDSPNCSICQICEGQATVFGRRIYSTANTEIDYTKGEAKFYEVEHLHSLNQSIDNPKPKVFYLPLLTAWEVFNCFSEIDKENVRRVETLFL